MLIAPHGPNKPDWCTGIYPHDKVTQPVKPHRKKQRSVHNTVPARRLGEPLLHNLNHTRMKDRFQFRQCLRIGKHNIAQLPPVRQLVLTKYLPTKPLHHLIGKLSQSLMSGFVDINLNKTTRREPLRNRAFASTVTPGNPDHHSYLGRYPLLLSHD